MTEHRPGRASRRPKLGPNAGLIGKPRSRQALATPAVILDLDGFERNLITMARLCSEAGLNLRPHAKTHKSVQVAKYQIAAGAVGVSVATLREAAVMVEAGVPGVLLTTPVVGAVKIDLLCGLVGKSRGFMVAVDNPANVAALEAALKRHGKKLAVLVDVDIGMHRTGVPDAAGVLKLVRRVEASRCWNSQASSPIRAGCSTSPGSADRARVYGRQLRQLERVLDTLTGAGYIPGIVSGGGTGTFDIDRRAGLFTECQCGSYAFMDIEYEDVQLFARGPNPFKTALFVQCMVVSNNHPRRADDRRRLQVLLHGRPHPEARGGRSAGRGLSVLRRRVRQDHARTQERQPETRSEDRARDPALRPHHQSA